MGDLSPNSQKQFAKISGLIQGVNAKHHAIYCFYSVLSVVNCIFQDELGGLTAGKRDMSL
jgi:hypothetical protein